MANNIHNQNTGIIWESTYESWILRSSHLSIQVTSLLSPNEPEAAKSMTGASVELPTALAAKASIHRSCMTYLTPEVFYVHEKMPGDINGFPRIIDQWSYKER